MASRREPSSTSPAIDYVDRAIEKLEAFVMRMARRGHGRLPGTVAMSRTYRAERMIAVLRKRRSALEAGDESRAEALDREFIALRTHARLLGPPLDG